MQILNSRAVLHCDHEIGIVGIKPLQNFVRIDGFPVLVRPDPEAKPIAGCPYAGMGVVPCNLTFPAERGYSSLIKIDGHPVCLDNVKGLTNGSPPPGTFYYTVKSPGQDFISEE